MRPYGRGIRTFVLGPVQTLDLLLLFAALVCGLSILISSLTFSYFHAPRASAAAVGAVQGEALVDFVEGQAGRARR
ncbi:MAG: hypothetical protein MO853_10500 [Candidatus Protistobacter heckmanni]|nr:hypothetical protein [Candidatus Protistobacter heckmanni]